MWQWFDVKAINAQVIGGLIVAIVVALVSILWRKFSFSFKKRSVEKKTIKRPRNKGIYDLSPSTYLIEIELFNKKLKVYDFHQILIKGIDGKVDIVYGSIEHKDDLLVFKVHVSPRSIEHEEIHKVLVSSQNGQYSVNSVFHIG